MSTRLPFCSQCGTNLERRVRHRINWLDVVGVLILGTLVFGLLGMFLLGGHGHWGGIIWLFGAIAFVLFHYIGYSRKVAWHCPRCREPEREPPQ